MRLELAGILILFSMAVDASGLMRLGYEDLTRLLTLASLPGEELEKEVKRMFFEGQRKMFSGEFLRLRELFSLRQMLSRAGREELPGDIIIIAMLVTDGDVQAKYVDAFEWNLEGKYGEELLKILIGEMETNIIYASMQRAMVASVIELTYHNAGSIIAYHCMGSQYWEIPGRWERVFEIMLNIEAIEQEILHSDKYDKELLGVVKKPEFADLFCEYIVKYGFVERRNREFMELQITNEILTDDLYMDVLDCAERGDYMTFLRWMKESNDSPERVLSDLIAEGYWLCLEDSEFDEFIRRLPEGYDVFRKLCERYPLEMKGIDRCGLSIEVLRAMTLDRKLDELAKSLIKRLVRCANITGLGSLLDAGSITEGLFLELLESGELKGDIKRGFKRAIKSYKDLQYTFTYFWDELGVRDMSDELSRSGEFDEDVKVALSMAIKNKNGFFLGWFLRDLPNAKTLLEALLCTVPRANELLGIKRFYERTNECSKRPAEEYPTCSLGSVGNSTKRTRTSE